MPADPRDYRLDIEGLGAEDTAGDDASGRQAARESSSPRPFLSVLFACCGVYQRVYRDADGANYEGRCPRCARPVRFVVGEGGTSSRCFVAE